MLVKSLSFRINRWIALWFCRPALQQFFYHGHKLMLRGLGLLNADGDDVTGENWLLDRLARSDIKTVVDVGANVSIYGYDRLPKEVRYFGFEPNPETFVLLQKQKYPDRVQLHQLAVGASEKTIKLYDFADDAVLKATQPTATLASTSKAVIEKLHHQKAKGYAVKQIALDDFLKKQKVTSIDLLKIDVEGYELAVLQGAKQLVAKQKINLIQFEFNEMHVYHRVFFKDFIDLLPNYALYRLGPNGLLPLPAYRPLTHEIFAFQNILAISNQNQARWLNLLNS